jgi:hypothetical protein
MPSTRTPVQFQPEQIRRLAGIADTVGAMLGAFDVLPPSGQNDALAVSASLADDLAQGLAVIVGQPELSAHQSASFAVDSTTLSTGIASELVALLVAIVKLSEGSIVVHDLSKVALCLAEDRLQMLEDQQAIAQERLAKLRALGGDHA